MPPKNGALAYSDAEKKFSASSGMMALMLSNEAKNFCRWCFVLFPMSLVYLLRQISFIEKFSLPLIRTAHLLGWVFLSWIGQCISNLLFI